MYETVINWKSVEEKPGGSVCILMLCKEDDGVHVLDGEYHNDVGFGVEEDTFDNYGEYAGTEFISFNDKCIGWIFYDELIPAELRKGN